MNSKLISIIRSLMHLMAIMAVMGTTACSSNKLHTYFKDYDLGVIKIANVGDPIVTVKDYYIDYSPSKGKCEAFYTVATKDFAFEGEFTQKLFFNKQVSIKGNKENKYLIQDSKTINGAKYDVMDILDTQGVKYGVLVGSDGGIFPTALYDNDHDTLYTSINAQVIPSEVKLVKDNTPFPCKVEKNADDIMWCNDVNFEIIYNGLNSQTISTTYREFTLDNLARPSFFQNQIYEPGAKTIRFKNLKIDILKADNEKIKFIVTEDGYKEQIVSKQNAAYQRCDDIRDKLEEQMDHDD